MRQNTLYGHRISQVVPAAGNQAGDVLEAAVIDITARARIGAISGIATFVLFFAGWAAWAGPGLPDLNSSTAVAAWFVEHADACRIAAILGSLSLPAMIAFDVWLYGILRDAEGGDGIVTRAFFGAALMTIVFDLMFLQFLFTAAFRPGHQFADVTQSLNDLFLGPGVAAFGCWMLEFGAIALIVLKRGGLPRALGYAAAAVSVSQLLFIPTSFVHSGTFDISNGLFGVFIPLGAPIVWAAATGMVMLRRSQGERVADVAGARASRLDAAGVA